MSEYKLFLAISRQFGLVQRFLGGIILGENAVLHLENEPKIAFKAIKNKKSAQKKCCSQW